MNIHDFLKFKQSRRPISMISCHDFWQAQLVESSQIDCILVGDSLAMLEHGFESTLGATMDMMALHTQSVVKGAPTKFVVADMPFLSYRTGFDDAVKNAGRLMCQGADAIKIEGAKGNLELISFLKETGIPVMGHLGLTPQMVNQLGGYSVQAKSNDAQTQLLEDCLALEKAGCFSLVLECVPFECAKLISQQLTIPVIGIGAGPYVDGQVLVFQDLLGFNKGFGAKFLRKYLNGGELVTKALNEYHSDVTSLDFPSLDESYK